MLDNSMVAYIITCVFDICILTKLIQVREDLKPY